MKRLALTYLLLLFPVCVLANEPALWLDENNLVILPGESRTLIFATPENSDVSKSALWIAARVVFPIEERLTPSLTIQLNGTYLQLDRLLNARPHFQMPCDPSWPTRTGAKCAVVQGVPAWTLRWDSDFMLGDTEFFGWRRQYAVENLAPSYRIGLAGLVRPGENRLVLSNLLRATDPPGGADLKYAPAPVLPYLAVHARFVRIGPKERTDSTAYDRTHTRPFDPRPRTFDVPNAAAFKAMEAYFMNAVETEQDAKRRSFLRFIHANYQLWKGQFVRAAELLETSLREAGDANWAEQAAFMLGVARSRTGDPAGTKIAWDGLKRRAATSPWAALAVREEAVLSSDRQLAPTNWPILAAIRVNEPPQVNGTLDDPAWQRAPVTDQFGLYRVSGQRPACRTEVRALYDERAFYLSVVCYEPAMDEVSNPHHIRDSNVFEDDCVELFLDPKRTFVQNFEFQLGAEGGILDCRNIWEISMMNFNPQRVDRVGRYADRWVAQMAISWEELAVQPPRAGDVWLCNVIRVRPASQHRAAETAVLGPVRERFGAPEFAAMLIFR